MMDPMMDRPPKDLAELAEEVAQFLRGRFKHPLVSRVELEVLKPATPENLLAEQSATITMIVNTRRGADYTLKFSVEHSP
jgi:dihydroneopterin aldolase